MKLKLKRGCRSIGALMACLIGFGFSGAVPVRSAIQEVSVYRGAVQYPDFAGRDKAYAQFRTRITKEMRTGPNFAGRYAIVEIGCGTSCQFAIVADVSTGRLYSFPYGGEAYYMLGLTYRVKSNFLTAKWVADQTCVQDDMEWDGARFTSLGKRVIGDRSRCEL